MTFLFRCFLIQIILTNISSIRYSCWSNSTCGCSLKSAVVTKIIGGEDATADTWGWAVSIRLGNNHICGGSLISSDLIISAAHCFTSIKTISSLSITAGSKSLSNINQRRSISEIFTHKNYNSNTHANDIALIRLSSPFNMNDPSLALICPATKTIEDSLNDSTVVAIGWGVLSTYDKTESNALQQVTLKMVASTAATCQRSIRNVKVQFCAGVSGGGKDTCQGDSGGPLMAFFDEKWYLIGITSYGIDCALPNYAGVYTRISAYEESIICFLKNDTLCIQKMFIIRNSATSIVTSFYMISFFILLFSFNHPLHLK